MSIEDSSVYGGLLAARIGMQIAKKLTMVHFLVVTTRRKEERRGEDVGIGIRDSFRWCLDAACG